MSPSVYQARLRGERAASAQTALQARQHPLAVRRSMAPTECPISPGLRIPIDSRANCAPEWRSCGHGAVAMGDLHDPLPDPLPKGEGASLGYQCRASDSLNVASSPFGRGLGWG